MGLYIVTYCSADGITIHRLILLTYSDAAAERTNVSRSHYDDFPMLVRHLGFSRLFYDFSTTKKLAILRATRGRTAAPVAGGGAVCRGCRRPCRITTPATGPLLVHSSIRSRHAHPCASGGRGGEGAGVSLLRSLAMAWRPI